MSIDIERGDSHHKIGGENYRVDRKNPFPGYYRARVEYRADPKKIGRVKIRIPQRHGIPEIDEDAFKVEDLPWAERDNRGVGGYDMGSFIIPHIGSWVWVKYEEGNEDKYIYGGGIHGNESEQMHEYGVVGEIPNDSQIPAGKWGAPVGKNEIPKDVFENNNSDEPTVDVLYKSLKGHTICFENEDEKESMSIIDRAGQIFKFISPVKDLENHTGDTSFQRGVNNAIKENCFDVLTQIFNKKGVVIVKDMLNQLFRMVAEWGKEKIELVARNRLVNKKQDIPETRQTAFQMNAGEGNINYFLLAEDIENENKVYLKADAINLKFEIVIVKEGEEVSRVELVEGDMNINLTGNLEKQVKGNLKDLVNGDILHHSKGDSQYATDGNYKVNGNNMYTEIDGIEDHSAGDLHWNSNSPESYSNDKFDYEPEKDATTWTDEKDEEYID